MRRPPRTVGERAGDVHVAAECDCAPGFFASSLRVSVDIRCEEKLLRPIGWTPAHVRGLTLGVLPEVATAATDRSKADGKVRYSPPDSITLMPDAGMTWKCG